MTGREAIVALKRGVLREQAAQWIDQQRERLAVMAFEEIYRLDPLLGYQANAGGAE
jgi:hypothetical protein